MHIPLFGKKLHVVFHWGYDCGLYFTVCGNGQESYVHLFFELMCFLSISLGVCTAEILKFLPLCLMSLHGISRMLRELVFKSWILKSVLAAWVYNQWWERNQRVFQHKASFHDLVILKSVNVYSGFIELEKGSQAVP